MLRQTSSCLLVRFSWAISGVFLLAAFVMGSVAVNAAENDIQPRNKQGKILNFGFETGTLEDWTATGNAFADQPIKGDTVSARRRDMRSNHQGDYWIGGYEKHGDKRTGTLTSAPFVVSHPYASFLTNGGQHAETRVELIQQQTGQVFFKINGTNNETLRRVIVDLRPYIGQEVLVRLVDEHGGGWGHLNFDHFRLHENNPGSITPPMVVLVDDEYPHAGLTAEEAVAAMKLPPGFYATVGAAEPDVKQPIAMAIDDRGRLWIAEAYEYPIRAKGERGRDRILIFEDTDGDGRLDQKKVFIEGLNLVSGLEVGFGGVWVGAAPYLLFIPDANGDDVPDAEPQILLDGWGHQDTHETLNAFLWGPDGWLYGCHGVFTHSRVGKPGTPDGERQPINAGVWRYHPMQHQFEVFAHGTSNPWGVDFNDHGQAFITACVIPHLYHVIEGARYQRQAGQHFNPHTYQDIRTIADHLHYLGGSPHGGNRKSDQAGGGHAHAGAMIYLGGHWPEEYRNQIFMNNIHGQRLNVDILKPRGSGYVGSHAPDFLLTGDKASQILNLRYGPDGNAWMIDWYDMQACHSGNVAAHDRSNGRIYKICYGEPAAEQQAVDLKKLSDLELARQVLSANDWYVRHSRRLLQERAAERPLEAAALTELRKISREHADDTRRLRALWALHVVGELAESVRESTRVDSLADYYQDQSPYVRGWAVQLAMQAAQNRPAEQTLAAWAALAESDPSPVVRLYLASAAQKLLHHERWSLLKRLVRHRADAQDHNLPLMYWYAMEPLAESDPQRALELAIVAGETIPLLQEFMLRRIASSNSKDALQLMIQGLGQTEKPALQLSFLNAVLTALKGQRNVQPPESWAGISAKLLNHENPQIPLQATALGVIFMDTAALEVMRKQVLDPQRPVNDRHTALQTLLTVKDPLLVPTLLDLLQTDNLLKTAAIRGLAQYEDSRIGAILLQQYAGLLPEQKSVVLATLCSRAETALLLLNAIQNQQLAHTDLTADLVQQLRFMKHAEVDALLHKVWGSMRDSPAEKLALIAEYRQLVESTAQPQPDLELGRAIFAQTCMKCHVLYGAGHKVGPDLTGSNRADLDYLLSNIVDPSAVMAKEYRSTIIVTEDGRTVTGILQAEDDHTVTLQSSDTLLVIAKKDIEDRAESEQSLMPDDQLKQFSPHQIRSLIAYLRAKEQTPLLATVDNARTFFNGQDLTGWSGNPELWSVENGELVGRSPGLKRNEWLVSDLSVENFRLMLEVKLLENRGNSGIQFRSQAANGNVSGYQADIGPGWWGKLYEEHGRQLLVDQPFEKLIKPGEWNRYEIVAKGNHIQTFLNGQPCVDLIDEKGAKRGIVAFQLHSGEAMEIRFRKIQLEVLE